MRVKQLSLDQPITHKEFMREHRRMFKAYAREGLLRRDMIVIHTLLKAMPKIEEWFYPENSNISEQTFQKAIQLLDKAFTPVSNLVKLANGMHPHENLIYALSLVSFTFQRAESNKFTWMRQEKGRFGSFQLCISPVLAQLPQRYSLQLINLAARLKKYYLERPIIKQRQAA